LTSRRKKVAVPAGFDGKGYQIRSPKIKTGAPAVKEQTGGVDSAKRKHLGGEGKKKISTAAVNSTSNQSGTKKGATGDAQKGVFERWEKNGETIKEEKKRAKEPLKVKQTKKGKESKQKKF